MDTNSNFNELLDSPIGLKTIRKSYFSAIEWSIMSINGLFTFLGVILFWKVAYDSETWLLYINPPIFILLFGLTPIIYIWQWRKASIEYDKSNNINLLQNISLGLIKFVYIGTGLTFGLTLLIFASMYYGASSFGFEVWQAGVVVIFIPMFILGPVQFLFIRMTKNIIHGLTGYQ